METIILLCGEVEISIGASQTSKGKILFSIEDEAFVLTDEEAIKISAALQRAVVNANRL